MTLRDALAGKNSSAPPKRISENRGVARVTLGRRLPVQLGTWNASEAKKRVFRWAAKDGKLDSRKARRAFVLMRGNGTRKGDYSLPVADVRRGKLVIIGNALANAEARLNQVKGVSPAVRAEALLRLNQYEAELEREYGRVMVGRNPREFKQHQTRHWELQQELSTRSSRPGYREPAGGYEVPRLALEKHTEAARRRRGEPLKRRGDLFAGETVRGNVHLVYRGQLRGVLRRRIEMQITRAGTDEVLWSKSVPAPITKDLWTIEIEAMKTAGAALDRILNKLAPLEHDHGRKTVRSNPHGTGKLTARTITDKQIRDLRSEAAAAGDSDLVRVCDRALARRGGRGECARAINDARAMEDAR